jgi:hypothetical protein
MSALALALQIPPSDDKGHRFEAELEIPASDRFFGAPADEYGDSGANLPSADYNQSIASERLGVRLERGE